MRRRSSVDGFADNLVGKLEYDNPANSVKDRIGAGFVPHVLRVDQLDDVIAVDRETTVGRSRQLAAREGILAGRSAGAAVEVADANPEALDVAVVPDLGERYLSTDLYRSPAATRAVDVPIGELAASVRPAEPRASD